MNATEHAVAAYHLLVAAPEGDDIALRQAGLHYRQAGQLATTAGTQMDYYRYESRIDTIRDWCTPEEKSQEVRLLLWLAKPAT